MLLRNGLLNILLNLEGPNRRNNRLVRYRHFKNISLNWYNMSLHENSMYLFKTLVYPFGRNDRNPPLFGFTKLDAGGSNRIRSNKMRIRTSKSFSEYCTE